MGIFSYRFVKSTKQVHCLYNTMKGKVLFTVGNVVGTVEHSIPKLLSGASTVLAIII